MYTIQSLSSYWLWYWILFLLSCLHTFLFWLLLSKQKSTSWVWKQKFLLRSFSWSYGNSAAETHVHACVGSVCTSTCTHTPSSSLSLLSQQCHGKIPSSLSRLAWSWRSVLICVEELIQVKAKHCWGFILFWLAVTQSSSLTWSSALTSMLG